MDRRNRRNRFADILSEISLSIDTLLFKCTQYCHLKMHRRLIQDRIRPNLHRLAHSLTLHNIYRQNNASNIIKLSWKKEHSIGFAKIKYSINKSETAKNIPLG